LILDLVLKMFKIFYGNDSPKETSPGELNIPGVVTIVGLLVIITAMGLYIPSDLKGLIENAVKIIIGG